MVDIDDIDELPEETREKLLESQEVQKLLAYEEHDLEPVSETLRGFSESDGYDAFVAEVTDRHKGRLAEDSVNNVIVGIVETIEEAYR